MKNTLELKVKLNKNRSTNPTVNRLTHFRGHHRPIDAPRRRGDQPERDCERLASDQADHVTVVVHVQVVGEGITPG